MPREEAPRDHGEHHPQPWEKAIEFKDKACRAFARHGLSYVIKNRDELE